MAVIAQNAGAAAFVKRAYGSPPGLWAYGEQCVGAIFKYIYL